MTPARGPDTVGFAVPGEWFGTFTALMNRVPNMEKAKISVHCHDDLGMGVANSPEAIRAGASQVESCFTGIDLKQLYRTVERGDSGWFFLLIDPKEKV